MCAGPGSRVYGAPSAKLAWYASARLAGNVPRTVFWPMPNVDSKLVAFTRHAPPPTSAGRRGGLRGDRRRLRPAPQDPAGRSGGLGRVPGGGRAPAARGRASTRRARGESLAIADFARIAQARHDHDRARVRIPVIVTSVTARVPAKINLQLAVGPLRADGYHGLVTVFHAISLFDEVTVVAAKADSVTVAGEGADHVPADGDNLALRAVRALREAIAARDGAAPDAGPDARGGVAVAISKRIPVAGGLAGGSADAAAALVACNALWQADLSQQELCEVAARRRQRRGLRGARRHRGRPRPGRAAHLGAGRARPLPLGARVRRGHLSTPAVYGTLDRQRGGTTSPSRSSSARADGRAAGRGRRTGSARRSATTCRRPRSAMFPALRKTLTAGREFGALGALVSGSGPTCFFLARDERHATDLAVALSGAGVCRSVAKATGAVPGASLVAR